MSHSDMHATKSQEACQKLHSFIVMEHAGDSMHRLLVEKKKKLSCKSVCKVIARLIYILECIHKKGLVFNNLGLKNILIGEWTQPKIENLKLIDFTLCTRYLDHNGDHIKYETVDNFVGNLALSSVNPMEFKSVSRRDDLISLTYLLILMNEKGRSFLNVIEDANKSHFELIRNSKRTLSPDQMCFSKKSIEFLPFVKAVHSLKFDEEPNYKYL